VETSKPQWITGVYDAHGHELTIGEPQPEHVEELSFSMRPQDRVEISRATKMAPYEALQWSLDKSAYSRVGLIDGQVTAVWGLVLWGSIVSCMGSPWAITSHVVDEYPKTFYRMSRFYVMQMREMCPRHLEVNVDSEYRKACRWLRRLGFDLTPIRVNGYGFFSAKITEGDKQCASR